MGPQWGPYWTHIEHPYGPTWNPVAKPTSLPYGQPILDPYRNPFGTYMGPTCFAITSRSVGEVSAEFIYCSWFLDFCKEGFHLPLGAGIGRGV